MKKTCNGCKALEIGTFGDKSKCALGFKTTEKKIGEYQVSRLVPLEQCPKPLTFNKAHRMRYNKIRGVAFDEENKKSNRGC